MSDSNTGDGGGRRFERVVGVLRERILDGTYPVKSFLPSQRDLAEEFDVSRDTVQRVIKELQSEGWLETRRGSGSRVVKGQRIDSPTSSRQPGQHPVTLRPLIEHAFEQPEVTLDVFTLTSESLDTHIRLQAERIRQGEIAPQSITLRMMVPSESLQLPYWRTKDGVDDGLLKERYLGIIDRSTTAVRSVLRNLKAEGLVGALDVQIRRALLVPSFKLYVLNRTEALYGPYTTFWRTIVLDDGREVHDVLDVEGMRAGLMHHVGGAGPRPPGTGFVEVMQEWFDSTWEKLTERPVHPVVGS